MTAKDSDVKTDGPGWTHLGHGKWRNSMWTYERKLQYPINIKNPNPAMAKFIITQYGGPDGEIGASLRYLSQRYSMPYRKVAGVLTDIGSEELGHFENGIYHRASADKKYDNRTD